MSILDSQIRFLGDEASRAADDAAVSPADVEDMIVFGLALLRPLAERAAARSAAGGELSPEKAREYYDRAAGVDRYLDHVEELIRRVEQGGGVIVGVEHFRDEHGSLKAALTITP